MQEITIPAKDYGYQVAFAIQYANSTIRDITNYNIKLKTWEPTVPGTLLVNKNCNTTNATLGTCAYNIASGDFNTTGIYYAELEMTDGAVVESTDKFKIIVAESG